ncbi:MAG TPA: BamA/TamA family outer membrane protein [Chitinophagaceae bacterium]|jgi:outer membrane protein assembly factor BamA|nr:BamA/TamA family outer membrane protein [Chitinophagaceae bacterium]
MKCCKVQISVLVVLLLSFGAVAQTNYELIIHPADSLSAVNIPKAGIKTTFNSRMECTGYVTALPASLLAKGFAAASVDSVRFDSASAYMVLYTGELYKWRMVTPSAIEQSLLDKTGWRNNQYSDKPFDFSLVQQWQEKMITWLENNGFPFAKTYLDSVVTDNGNISALIRLEKGPLYKIDSIRNFGNARIANGFLQRYLDLPNGSIYSKEKLSRINTKIRELTYLEEQQPSQLTMLGTGSVLDLFLKQKKSSQVNVLVGFLPNNDQLSTKKILITGEANVLLKNAFGSGETIGLNWQQIQVKSPRLNILYNHPFLFQSPLGLDFSFDMFKKDSSFLNVNFQFGAQYVLNTNQSGKLFIQRFQTIVSQGGINTPLLLASRKLPEVADVSSLNLGVDYEYNNTDYRLNPRKGNELRLITSAGTKTLKKNNQVTELKDPTDPSFDFGTLYDTIKLKTYQFRVRVAAARYFPLPNNRSTIKTAVNAGMFQSGNTFRNELFQVGGYKLLRGFDEESEYLSTFAIATTEFRYLIGQNSFFYVLADGGWGKDASKAAKPAYTYFGTGLGLSFETKAGIFNIAWAVGKRNDTDFNLRKSKLHFGFVNYF